MHCAGPPTAPLLTPLSSPSRPTQVKEIVQIVLAMLVFNENLSARSVGGIALSIFAAAAYRRIKVTLAGPPALCSSLSPRV